MALTVREIMERFASGTLGDLSFDMEYSEDLPDLRGLDISQISELRESYKESYNNATDEVRRSAKENRELKARIKAEQDKVIEDAKIVE